MTPERERRQAIAARCASFQAPARGGGTRSCARQAIATSHDLSIDYVLPIAREIVAAYVVDDVKSPVVQSILLNINLY
jgi:hypothetical protein